MAGIPQPGFRRHQGKAEDTRHLRRPQSLRPGRGARAGPGVFPHRKKVLKAPDTSKARVLVVGDVMLDRDRKSTRLNSSHLVISYAVFCLKKKKKKKPRRLY